MTTFRECDAQDAQVHFFDDSLIDLQSYWQKKASWTVSHANQLRTLLSNTMEKIALNYVQSYISLGAQGKNFMWLNKRATSNSLLRFNAQNGRADEIAALLDENQIPYTRKGPRGFRLSINDQLLSQKQNAFIQFAKFIGESSDED